MYILYNELYIISYLIYKYNAKYKYIIDTNIITYTL